MIENGRDHPHDAELKRPVRKSTNATTNAVKLRKMPCGIMRRALSNDGFDPSMHDRGDRHVPCKEHGTTMKIKPTLSIGALLALAFTSVTLPAPAQKEDLATEPHASSTVDIGRLIAVIRPVGDSRVEGTVIFTKVDEDIKIVAKIGGLTPNTKHAIHIHEFGDLGSDDATSAGDHFNPDKHPHALPDKEERHAGDLGNLEANADGNAVLDLTVTNITLDLGPRGILGRAVIVHAKPDDGGQPSGNAGHRIGAGVIGLSKDAMEKETPAGTPSKKTEATQPDAAADGGKAE
jgi:Cu-Zn family superoxide dismutase